MVVCAVSVVVVLCLVVALRFAVECDGNMGKEDDVHA